MTALLLTLLLMAVFSAVIANAQNQPPAEYDGRWTTHPAEIQMKIDLDGWRNELREIHLSKEENFERVEFEFSGSFVPICRVRYVNSPFNSASTGENVEIAGNAFLEVALMPAFVRESESGREIIGDRKEVSAGLRLESVKDIRRVYDHEGRVVYLVGLNEEKRFRVLPLPKPSRLVIDVNNF